MFRRLSQAGRALKNMRNTLSAAKSVGMMTGAAYNYVTRKRKAVRASRQSAKRRKYTVGKHYRVKSGKLMLVKKAGLKKLIDKQIHKDKPSGKYHKHVVFEFPQVQSSAAAPLQNVVNQVNYAGSTIADGRLSVGTYGKLIDAVSVLFNGKAADLYTATGDLSPGGVIIPDFKHLAVYEFTNNTTLNQCFLIYEFTPKEDSGNSVYASWNACTNTQVGGTTRGITYFGMRPEMFSQFRDLYKQLKKVQITLKPGERYTYKMQTSVAHLKLDDWLPVGSLTPTFYRKNFTKELLIINWNVGAYGQPDASQSYMGHTWNAGGTTNYGIGVSMHEYYSMRCPDNVSNTNNDDNVFCVFSKYPAELNTGGTSTVVTPSISFPAIQQ